METHKKVRIGPLRDIAGIRRELSRLYRGARLGEISTQDASRLTYILREIREASVFERRIDAIEAAQAASDERGRFPARRRAALEARTTPAKPEERCNLDVLTIPELKRLEGILVRQESGAALSPEDQAWLEQIKEKIGDDSAESGSAT